MIFALNQTEPWMIISNDDCTHTHHVTGLSRRQALAAKDAVDIGTAVAEARRRWGYADPRTMTLQAALNEASSEAFGHLPRCSVGAAS